MSESVLARMPSWLNEVYTTRSEATDGAHMFFSSHEVTFRSLTGVVELCRKWKHIIPVVVGGGALGKYWSIAFVPESQKWIRIWAGGSESREISEALHDFRPGDRADFDYEMFDSFERVIENAC